MQHRGSLVSSSLVLALIACGCSTSPATTTAATDTGSSTSSTSSPASSSGTSSATDAPTSTDASTSSTGAPTSTTGDSSTGDPAITIYDVQQGKFAQKSVVTIKGVVVTSPIREKAGKGIVFVEEVAGGEYSGIALELDATVLAALDAPPGSVVDFTGTYSEAFGNSQIAVQGPADITVIGTDTVPAPAVVLAADVSTGGAKAEPYEGVLVQIHDALVTIPAADVGQFEVEGGARVSDFFLYDLGLSPKPKAGQIYPSITGPLLTVYDELQIAPRSLEDLDDGEANTTGDDTTGDGTTGDTTTGDTTTGEPPEGIYAVQQGAYNVGDLVVLEGVVATSGPTIKKDGFFIQEPGGGPYSGIFVFVKKGAIAVQPGDVLTIAGTYEEYFDLSEIVVPDVSAITKTDTAPVPAPAILDPADIGTGGPKSEQYEGVLVKVEGVQVTAAVDVNNEFIVDGVLRVDDLFFTLANWPKPAVGAPYTAITGPLTFSTANFKLVPRSANDLVK